MFTGFMFFYDDGSIINIGGEQISKSNISIMDDAFSKETNGVPVALEKGLRSITVDSLQRIENAVLEILWSEPVF